MVEPITLAAISGISALGGLVAGKISKKEKGTPIIDQKGVGVEFLALKERVKPRQLRSVLSKGKPMFINLKDLTYEKNEFKQFLTELQALGDEMMMKINSVSPSLLLVTPADQKINIRTLARTEANNRNDSIEINGS